MKTCLISFIHLIHCEMVLSSMMNMKNDLLQLVIEGLGRMLCISPGSYSTNSEGDEADAALHADSRVEVADWLRLAQVLDRLMVIIFSILVTLIAFIYVVR